MTGTTESASLRVVAAAALLWSTGLAVAQSPAQLPAQAQTPGQGTPALPAQAPAPANPPDAPVPAAPVFPPPTLPRAETPVPAQASPPAQGVPPRPASQSTAAPVPNADLIIMLVRSTLAAFNHANLTNNYSVLHALAAPSFQQDNDIEKLRDSFASFRERKIDIAAVEVLAPRFIRPAEIDGQGILRVTGFFPSRPLQLRFNMAFQSVEGSGVLRRWRWTRVQPRRKLQPSRHRPRRSPSSRQP